MLTKLTILTKKEIFADLFRFDRLWAFIAFAGILGIMNLAPILPNDYWFHVEYGFEILAQRSLPWNDTFTFTMFGTPYPALGIYWLGEVLMASIHRFAPGWQTSVYGLVIFAAYWAIFKASLRRSGNIYASGIALILGVVLGVTNWNIRPQIFAYLYFAIIIYCLPLITDPKNGKINLLPLSTSVIALLLWQNTHGTFLFGYLLIGAAFLRSFSGQRLLIALVMLCCLPFISPLGLRMPAYFLQMLGANMASRNIIEWQPALITEITGKIFYPLLAIVLLLGVKRPKYHWTEWILFAFLLILSLRYRRAILFWGMYIIPMIATEFTKLSFFNKELKTDPSSTKLNLMVIMVVSMLLLLTYPPIKTHLPIPDDRKDSFSTNTPTSAVTYMRQNLAAGNVFAHYSYSAYITYQTRSEYKTFMDTRFDLFNDDVFDDYLILNGAKDGWRTVAAKYPIDHWLISKTDQPSLDSQLRTLASLKLVYEDDGYALFTRVDR